MPPLRAPRRVLFVGNSLTYQPKELGGLPGAVARVAAAASGEDLHCDAVTQGGADLLDLWDEFEERIRRGGEAERWDVVVLQVGRGGGDEASRFAVVEVLRHRYGPLLAELQPSCEVLLYQTWSDPGVPARDDAQLDQGVEAYREALVGAFAPRVRIARAGTAFRLVKEGASLGVAVDKGVYPALFKDDSGHPSALAGLLVAAVIVRLLGCCGRPGEPPRPLGKILAAILPSAWRTASSSYAGTVELNQRGWLDGNRNLPAGLIDDGEDLGALSRYPPGLRTEKRSLGPFACDALAAAAGLAVQGQEEPGAQTSLAASPAAVHWEAPSVASDGTSAASGGPSRRWRAR